MAHIKRDRLKIHFGARPWERTAEGQAPGACDRCGGALPADGRTYCAACHALPGGEIDAARDDRIPEEEREPEPPYTVGDTGGVEVRKGITVPKKYARGLRSSPGVPGG